jgi:hypothetical protein
MIEPLLKKGEVAKWLSIQPRGVESLTARGILPAIRIGAKCVRYNKSDIEQRLNKFRTKTR